MRILSAQRNSTYIGEFKNNKREGKGVSFEQNGDFYEGGWIDNKKHGRGTLKC
jgi:hypothetical protein